MTDGLVICFYGDLATTRMSSFSCNSGNCYVARVELP